MKPAGLLLLIPAGLVVIAAAGETEDGLVTRETKNRIKEGLPTYQPPPPKTDGETTEPAPPTAPDVLVLPKMTVKEKRLPPDPADHLMSKGDFNRKMENLYFDSVAEDGPLNVLLNTHAIPILNKISIPIPPRRGEPLYQSVESTRGRAIYRAKEVERFGHVNSVSKSIDPEAAKKFKQETDSTHTTRPASGPVK